MQSGSFFSVRGRALPESLAAFVTAFSISSKMSRPDDTSATLGQSQDLTDGSPLSIRRIASDDTGCKSLQSLAGPYKRT